MTQQQQQQKPKSPLARNQVQASNQTREKAESAKAYIERKYAKLKSEEKEKKEAWDYLFMKMDKLNLSENEKE